MDNKGLIDHIHEAYKGMKIVNGFVDRSKEFGHDFSCQTFIKALYLLTTQKRSNRLRGYWAEVFMPDWQPLENSNKLYKTGDGASAWMKSSMTEDNTFNLVLPSMVAGECDYFFIVDVTPRDSWFSTNVLILSSDKMQEKREALGALTLGSQDIYGITLDKDSPEYLRLISEYRHERLSQRFENFVPVPREPTTYRHKCPTCKVNRNIKILADTNQLHCLKCGTRWKP